MPKTTKALLALAVLVLAALACNAFLPTAEPTPTMVVIVEPTSPQEPLQIPASEAEVPRASLEQARTALESGAAVMVDVRSAEAYNESHVAGAINIPLNEIESNPTALTLAKDQWIITYCTWPDEHLSARAAFVLSQSGYTHVTPLLGGFAAWINAGYPVEQ